MDGFSPLKRKQTEGYDESSALTGGGNGGDERGSACLGPGDERRQPDTFDDQSNHGDGR